MSVNISIKMEVVLRELQKNTMMVRVNQKKEKKSQEKKKDVPIFSWIWSVFRVWGPRLSGCVLMLYSLCTQGRKNVHREEECNREKVQFGFLPKSSLFSFISRAWSEGRPEEWWKGSPHHFISSTFIMVVPARAKVNTTDLRGVVRAQAVLRGWITRREYKKLGM